MEERTLTERLRDVDALDDYSRIEAAEVIEQYREDTARDERVNNELRAERDGLAVALKQARTMLKAYGSDYDPCHIALMNDIDAALATSSDTDADR